MNKKLILKASAGTGKTYRLSLEYIASLLQGTDFREILVMTFTRKATSEIKERILSFLYGMCHDLKIKEEVEGNLKKIYGEDFVVNEEKVNRIYQDISRNRDGLKIYTIDAFTNLLFRNAIAPYLKLYSYEIIPDEENHDILVDTFQKLFENSSAFYMFKEFLEDNSEKDMENYISLISNVINERWKIIVIGENLYKTKEKYSCEDIERDLESFVELFEQIGEIKGKEVETLLKKDFKDFWSASDRKKYIYENYELFLKSNPWHGNKVKVTKKGKDNEEILKMTEIYSNLQENLARTQFNEVVLPYERKILNAITTIYDIYDKIKLREKRFTYTDISNYTFKYLQDKELGFLSNEGYLTDEFFEIIDGKITSIFIDEFQDTSILQWKILKNIIDRSRDIICVGDEKQSIYGWRGGEKRLFENLETIIDGKVEMLDTCYRSRENIVEYVNEVFGRVSGGSATECRFNKKWSYFPVKYTNKDKKGYVEIVVGNEEETAVEQLLSKLLNDFKDSYNGVGIIARTRATLREIGDKLAQYNIPYTLESEKNIFESPGIRPLYSLIKWMVRGDYMALLECLRSELVGISALSMKEMIERKEEITLWFEDEKTCDDLCNENILAVIKELYLTYKKQNGQTVCLAYEMITKLGVTDVYSTNEDMNDIFSFYKILKEYKYFNDFLIDFEENSDNDKFKKEAGKGEGISLMTIHKSKGLEFDTVFYFMPKSPRHRSYTGLKTYFKTDEYYDKAVDFLITHTRFNCIFENIDEITYLEEEAEKERLEELNNLYVALTRPKENLFVVIEDMETLEKDNMIYVLSDTRGELEQSSEQEKEESLPKENSAPVLCAFEKEYKIQLEENVKTGEDKLLSHDLEIENRRVLGNVLHFFLENIKHWTKEEEEFSKRLTFSRFISLLPEEKLTEILSVENIKKIKTACGHLFDDKWDYVHNEYTVAVDSAENNEKKIYRIDRIMVKEPGENEKGEILIADYKTGGHDETQLEQYTDAIRKTLEKNRKNVSKYDIKFEYIELNI